MLAFQARWVRRAGLAGLVGAFIVAASVVLQQAGLNVPSGKSNANQLVFEHAHSSRLIYSSILQAIGLMMFLGPLLFLFRSANGRAQRMRGAFVGLIIVGPLAFGLGLALSSVGSTKSADKFHDQEPAAVQQARQAGRAGAGGEGRSIKASGQGKGDGYEHDWCDHHDRLDEHDPLDDDQSERDDHHSRGTGDAGSGGEQRAGEPRRSHQQAHDAAHRRRVDLDDRRPRARLRNDLHEPMGDAHRPAVEVLGRPRNGLRALPGHTALPSDPRPGPLVRRHRADVPRALAEAAAAGVGGRRSRAVAETGRRPWAANRRARRVRDGGGQRTGGIRDGAAGERRRRSGRGHRPVWRDPGQRRKKRKRRG